MSTSSNGSCRKIDTEEDLLDVIISTKYSFIIYNSYKSNPNDDSLNILCKDLEASDEKIIDEIKASNLEGIIVYGDYIKYWDSPASL